MKFTVGVAMSPLDQLGELAQTAEEYGYSSIALPDSLFYMAKASAKYPYTPDGSRFWDEATPWVDPFVAAAAMGAVTSRIRFYTQVLKLNPRNPVLLARQVGSAAVAHRQPVRARRRAGLVAGGNPLVRRGSSTTAAPARTRPSTCSS